MGLYPSGSANTGTNSHGHSSTRAAMIYQHATQDRDEAIAKALGGLWSQVHTNVAAPADEA